MQFPLKLDARFLKRSYAKRMFYGAWKLAIAYLFILIFVGVSYSDPELRGWCIFFLAVAGVGTAIFVAAWIRQSKSIDDWVSRQGDAPVVYALSEGEVESTSQVGSTKLKWDAFSGLMISDFDTLLLFPRSAGALTLPTDQVPSSAIEYLKARFTAVGKKVEDKRKKAQSGSRR
ncbi:MAG: hypothetical protein BWX86_00559 [Verrucomicrobia bacterium ADurb.Bin122]|nr:MAG: hypothetical protein BWX86_00559 [Verrucomicrobia bacterium ADurb.Bin122]HOG92669.1 hypothetical protein [Opitutaceae bacterium]